MTIFALAQPLLADYYKQYCLNRKKLTCEK